jgi:hypothetical protein
METRKLSSLFWKNLEAYLFSLLCLFSVNTVQNSENSELPDASKCFQTAKTVQMSYKTVSWSQSLRHTRVYGFQNMVLIRGFWLWFVYKIMDFGFWVYD